MEKFDLSIPVCFLSTFLGLLLRFWAVSHLDVLIYKETPVSPSRHRFLPVTLQALQTSLASIASAKPFFFLRRTLLGQPKGLPSFSFLGGQPDLSGKLPYRARHSCSASHHDKEHFQIALLKTHIEAVHPSSWKSSRIHMIHMHEATFTFPAWIH